MFVIILMVSLSRFLQHPINVSIFMKIGMVMITEDIEIQGPNGIHIGMGFSDVINSSCCDEEKVYDIENMKESELKL